MPQETRLFPRSQCWADFWMFYATPLPFPGSQPSSWILAESSSCSFCTASCTEAEEEGELAELGVLLLKISCREGAETCPQEIMAPSAVQDQF